MKQVLSFLQSNLTIIIVFLIDRIYNFIQSNNGGDEIRNVNHSMGNLQWNHNELQKQNLMKTQNRDQRENKNQHPQDNRNNQQLMENELNKLFQNDNIQTPNLQNEQVTIAVDKIESSNILDLPIDT